MLTYELLERAEAILEGREVELTKQQALKTLAQSPNARTMPLMVAASGKYQILDNLVDFLQLEKRWLQLARSYEFADRRAPACTGCERVMLKNLSEGNPRMLAARGRLRP